MSRRRPLRPGQQEEVDGESSASQSFEKPCVIATRSQDPTAFLAIPWHACMVLFYSLLLYHGIKVRYSNMHILDPTGKIPVVGGLFKYLTHINQWVQLLFFSMQLLTDITPCQYKAKLQKASSFVFTTATFPCSVLVATTFWGIYAFDRKYVYPEIFDTFVPSYLNHFWHTTIVVWVLCEIYLVCHKFPSTSAAAVAVFLFGSLYIGWIFYIFFTANWWVYPFMKHLPPAALSLFLGFCLFYMFSLFFLGKYVSNMCWGASAGSDGDPDKDE